MIDRVANSGRRTRTRPGKEPRWRVVVQTDDGVGEQDSALKRKNDGQNDEKWHRDRYCGFARS